MKLTGITITRNTPANARLLERVAGLPGGQMPAPDFAVAGESFGLQRKEYAHNISFCGGCIRIDTADASASLTRERFGAVSLYHAEPEPGCIIFSTELRIIQTLVRGDINRNAFADLFRLGYVPAPECIYSHIHKVQAGRTDNVSITTGHFSTHLDFTLPPIDATITDADAMDELEARLRQAVGDAINRAETGADTLLSGGIDSGLVTGIAQRFFPDCKRHSIAVNFEYDGYDEGPIAAQTAELNRISLKALTMTQPDVLARLPKLLASADEPFADASLTACAMAYAAFKPGRAILTGDGGDELFGGYRRYRAMSMMQSLPHWLGKTMRPFCKIGAALLPDNLDNRSRLATLKRTLKMAALPTAEAYASFQEMCSNASAREIAVQYDVPEFIGRWEAELAQSSRKTESLLPCNALDLQYYLPEDCSRKAEIAANATGRQILTPLTEGKIADFALSLPQRLRFDANAGKLLLRRFAAEKKYLPNSALNAPKRGFGLPLAQWFRKGPLAKEMAAVAAQTAAWDKYGLLNANAVRKLSEEHLAGHVNHANALWLILCLHYWMQALPSD